MKGFRINPERGEELVLELERSKNELHSRIKDISRKTGEKFDRMDLVGGVINLNDNPEDLRLLSKVFERVADILEELKEVDQKLETLYAVKKNSSFLGSVFGEFDDELETFLTTLDDRDDVE